MGFLTRFRQAWSAASAPAPRADGGWISLDDPLLAEYLRGPGSESAAGQVVSTHSALLNTAVFRSVSLISYAIGMLPLHLIHSDTKEKAADHPLFPLLHREPNNWQTAFDFRTLMQMRALVKGNAYAYVVRAGSKILRLVPLEPDQVRPRQLDDWSVVYEYQPPKGGAQTLQPSEVLHLRGLSMDGICGISLVRQARQAIGLALAADVAVARLYKNGAFVGGTLNTDKKLSPEVRARLRESWGSRYEGAENAGKTPILEEGLKHTVESVTARDSQTNETRARQVEEIARVFGVPRPLLMVDETSWGSGIDVLGQFFVRYALNPWFEAWQQAIERTLLTNSEKGDLQAKFNASALLRGSMAQQGEFFAQALGTGGGSPWMTQNEVRDVLDMPAHADGDGLTNPMAPQPPDSGRANDGKSQAAAA